VKKIIVLVLLIVLISCKKKEIPKSVLVEKPKKVYKYGYDLSEYKMIKDTVKKNETFGYILDKNHIETPVINKIVQKSKEVFDIARQLRVGKTYTIIATKDSTQKAAAFIYHPNRVEDIVFNLKDSIYSRIDKKEIKIIEKTASGIITTNLSNAIEQQGINYALTYKLSDIYAWTVDFFHLQKGDKFKVIYEEKFINDSTSVGIGEIKAAYFEHGNKPFYAFRFVADSTTLIPEYFDEKTTNLRRAFLKAPLKFSSRVSSRYNLQRRIKHYGYRVRPHKGTDFPSPIGTPIIATANGRVVESRYSRGNGNYVKIKHNNIYSTQYLHMKKRKVKVDDVVKQGDVIGWIGMTGSTAGPHVCYRFWKNGKQVDPFRQKLPAAAPMNEAIKPKFFEFIKSLKNRLDNISYPKQKEILKIDSLTIALNDKNESNKN
jgi:murein DD-endopeptidase MepM/ murein hydrolase activator NlpD